MILRIAKPSDKSKLAALHILSSSTQPGGFIHKLGKDFLRQYYQVFLDEKMSIILVAEDEQGNLLGFCSGTLSAEDHYSALNRSRIRLFLSTIPAILRSPMILKGILSRQKSLTQDNSNGQYVDTEGIRGEMWAWDPNRRDAAGAIQLLQVYIDLIKCIKVPYLRFEVDNINIKIVKIHQILGAVEIMRMIIPDGRERIIMEYRF